MKTVLSVMIVLCIAATGFSQVPADALRYSFITGQGGTARNQAIGGAGGSLGGEFSSMFINPAGLGFYKTGDFVITPVFSSKLNESTYLNNVVNQENNKLSLSTTGLAFASNTPHKKVKNVTIGIGINRQADFNNHIYYYGENNNSSYSEKYLEELINNNVTDPNSAASDYPFGASMAFNTYLIDTLAGPSGEVVGYKSQADPSYGLGQRMDMKTKGGITDASLAVGVNMEDKWFFGGSLSFPFLKYTRYADFKEDDLGANPYFDYFEANEMLETKGVGINAKLGVIYKPMESVRLGLAFHSPTFYQLTDYYNMQIIADLQAYTGQGALQQSSSDLNDGDLLRSKYNMSTPWRAILSGSYVIGASPTVKQQKGFITADVEYVNYTNMAFHSASNNAAYATYYKEVNKTIDDLYRDAVNVRIGGEVKLNTFMVRLGGAYYGNPYKDQTGGVSKVTGGIGYRNGGMFIDLAMNYAITKDVDYPYLLQDKPNNAASIKTTGSQVALTVGFKL